MTTGLHICQVLYFSDYKMHSSCPLPCQIWEGNGGVSSSLKVAFLACCGEGGQWWSGFSYFPPLILGTSYGPVCLIVQKIRYMK